MKFTEVIEHLTNRGFITNLSEKNKTVYFFGKGSVPKRSYCYKGEYYTDDWYITVDDLKSEDWAVILLNWGSVNDDFLPFKEENIKITTDYNFLVNDEFNLGEYRDYVLAFVTKLDADVFETLKHLKNIAEFEKTGGWFRALSIAESWVGNEIGQDIYARESCPPEEIYTPEYLYFSRLKYKGAV